MNTKIVGNPEIVPNLMKAAGIVAAAGAGAGLMFFFDPVRGKARRAQCLDQAAKLARDSSAEIEKTVRDLEHRAEGLFADLRHHVEPEKPVSDAKLEARIHTKLGRVASFPRMIRVMSLSGNIILGGFAPAGEAEAIIQAVTEVPGVRAVECRIEVPALEHVAAQ